MDDAAIRDLFAALGPVTIKRMFGGKGVYAAPGIVAVEVDGDILLKADSVSAPAFAAAGCRQWTYEGKKAPVTMPYWTIPPEAFDDPDDMSRWTRLAYEAAARAAK